MQQRPGDFHPATMAAIQGTHSFVAPLGQLLAGQFRVDAHTALAPRQAMQRDVITQVLLDTQVQVQGALLEYHAQLAQGRPRRGLRRLSPAGVEHGARVFDPPQCLHRPEVYGGIGEREAAALLRAFFAHRR